MEEYIVSARKYRPMTFDSVVGQAALTTTLKNAVKSGKLAHAYLFCGPRGVGKLLVPEFLPRQSTASTLTKTVRHATNARAVARSTNSVPSISLSWMLPATTVLTKSRP